MTELCFFFDSRIFSCSTDKSISPTYFLELTLKQLMTNAYPRAPASRTTQPLTPWTTSSTKRTSELVSTKKPTREKNFYPRFLKFVFWRFNLPLNLTKLFCRRRPCLSSSCEQSIAIARCRVHLDSSAPLQVIKQQDASDLFSPIIL